MKTAPKTKSAGRTLIVTKDANGKTISVKLITNPRLERVRPVWQKRASYR